MWIRIILAAFVLFTMLECKAVVKVYERMHPNEAEINEIVEAGQPNGKKHFTDMRYELEENHGKVKRSTKSYNRWLASKNGALVIPYAFDSSISESKKKVIEDAVRGLNDVLDCHSPFVQRDIAKHGNLHYLKFFSGGGCWSYVGKSHESQGFQQISIGNGCEYIGTVQHEVLHALGFGHEQSREDRDQYVEIKLENVQSGYEGNFKKMTGTSEISKKSTYDYSSIMHYGEKYFSRNGLPTIITKDPTATIGQRDKLSKTDSEELNKYFKCDGYVFVTDPPTTTTTRAPVSKSLLQTTKFQKKYQDGGIFYSQWKHGGCFNQYSNCDTLKNYCNQANIKAGCPITCGCPPSDPESYVELPSGVSPGTWIFKRPYINAQMSATEMHTKCTPCTTSNCPTIPVCVKATMERSPDYTSSSVGYTHSKIAIGAYNSDSNNYVTTLKYPRELGKGQETMRTIYSMELDMTCQAMNVYVNGTKGNDNIRLYQLDVYYGTCRSALDKRNADVAQEFVIKEDSENMNKFITGLKVEDITPENEVFEELKPKNFKV